MSRSPAHPLAELSILFALSFLIGGSASAICADDDGDSFGSLAILMPWWNDSGL